MANILGTSGNDILTTTAANDSIWGGTGGQDTAVFTGNLADYSVTDNGDGSYYIQDMRDGSPDGRDKFRAIESFEFADQTVTLETLLESTTSMIQGTDGSDTLNGGAFDEMIEGGAGYDTIWGAGGNDTAIYSGSVYDYTISENANGTYTITDTRDGAPDGVDTVRDVENFQFSDVTVTLEDFVQISEESSTNEVTGGGSDDVMLGTDGNDVFQGGAGDDTIWGGMDGEDRLVYSGNMDDYGITLSPNGAYYVYDKRSGTPDGVDKVRNIDVFEFADGTMTLGEFVAANGGEPGFLLTGTNGNDVLIGDALDDTLTPMEGNDRVWGGFEGEDTAVFTGYFDDYVVTVNDTGAITLVDTRISGNDGVHVVRSVEEFQFADQTVSYENIFDGIATDSQITTRTITGTAADDTFRAAHTDGLYDAYTNELLVGNAGSDRIYGGPGDDILYGDEIINPDQGEYVFTSTPDTDLPRFEFGEGLYQVIYGQVKKLNPETGEYDIVSDDYPNINATGLNPADGYAYGIGTGAEWRGHLLRIGSNGEIEDLGGGYQRSFTGGFTEDGSYLVRKNNSTMVEIDVVTGTQTEINFTGPSMPTVHDIAFIGNKGYGVTPSGILVTYDLDTQTVSTASLDGVPVGQGAFGAVWTAADGGLYVSHNRSGNIYGISGHENGDPAGVLLTEGETAGINDGFSYGNAELPEALTLVGDDYLLGGTGDDTLYGGDGIDKLDGGVGADDLFGGEGRDWAIYSRAEAAVVADLANGGTVGEAAGDSYDSIENLKGSKFDDALYGDDLVNHIEGYDGDDVIDARGGDDNVSGGAGADDMDGGDGVDMLSYIGSSGGVTIDTATGTGSGSGSDAEGDTFVNFESILGSKHDDTFHGSDGTDVFIGDEGNDTFNGSVGNDSLWGGQGNDVVIYDGNSADYTITQVMDAGATDDARYQYDWYYTIAHNSTGEVDRVRDVETVEFNDTIHILEVDWAA